MELAINAKDALSGKEVAHESPLGGQFAVSSVQFSVFSGKAFVRHKREMVAVVLADS
jgi:hypothetical protein